MANTDEGRWLEGIDAESELRRQEEFMNEPTHDPIGDANALFNAAYHRGYAAAVDEAIRRVEGLPVVSSGIGMKDDVLAALAAMKDSPKGLTDDH